MMVDRRLGMIESCVHKILTPSIAGFFLVLCATMATAQDIEAIKESAKKAYSLSQSAQTEEQFSAVIKQCEQGLQAIPMVGPGDKSYATLSPHRKYLDDLMSWSLNRRGELRADAGKDDEALKDFEQAIKLKTDNWRALHNRAVSFAMVGKNDEALADFNQAIKLERSYAAAYFNRGELFSSQGKWTESIADYTQSIKLNDKDPRALTNRGYAHYQMRNFDLALADYGRAISVDKEWPWAYVHRGALHGDMARWKQATDDYRQAIKIAPDLGHAYQQVAWLLATCPDKQYRDPKLALDAAKKAIELDSDRDFHYLDTLGAAYAANGQFDPAIEAVKKAIAGLPMGFEAFKADLESRLKLYEGKEAYVEQTPILTTKK